MILIKYIVFWHLFGFLFSVDKNNLDLIQKSDLSINYFYYNLIWLNPDFVYTVYKVSSLHFEMSEIFEKTNVYLKSLHNIFYLYALFYPAICYTLVC